MINLIKSRIAELAGGDVKTSVVASEKADFGHYSTNAAFQIASVQKKAPFEVAKELAAKLSSSNEFEKVEAVPPGFINFWLKPEVLREELKEILKKKNKYGSPKTQNSKPKARKINLEFVSANPTGPLTMANGRGGFYGDVLANVLENSGQKVTREYYINDAGNQVFILGLSILNKTAPEKVEQVLARHPLADKAVLYMGGYIDTLASILGAGRLREEDPLKIGKRATRQLLRDIKTSLKKAGIRFDVWFSEEKKLHQKGELDKALKFLEKQGMVEKKDGAIWLKGADAVLVKSDGNPTYFLADLAYHYDKFLKRKFDVAIDIWGADHHGYKARMEKGVAALGVAPGQLKILITQLVRLVSGGKEVRMSKRKGEFVTMDDLLEEVGADAARFFFLMHSLDTHMDFDLDLAKEKSQKNPVYYAQYAYVRVLNILKRANSRSEVRNPKLDLLTSDSEIKLLLELVKFPDILAQTAEDYQVHRLTKYALELAKALHNFYEKERVVGIENGELEKARLALVSATKITLENLFSILGIGKPKKM